MACEAARLLRLFYYTSVYVVWQEKSFDKFFMSEKSFDKFFML